MNQHFYLDLGDTPDVAMTDEMQEALGNAGCDDSLSSSCDGQCKLTFDRDAPTLLDAVRSAIAQAEGCGLHVIRIRLEDENPDLSEADFANVDTLNLMLQLRTRVKSQAELTALWQDFAHAT